MLCYDDLQVCSKWGTFRALVWGSTVAAPAVCRPRLQFIWCSLSPAHRMYRRTSNMVGLSYPPTVISVLKVLTPPHACPYRRTVRTRAALCVCACACFYLNSPLCPQNVDKWSFDVFALNEASGDHALKFIFYELLTRYDLISRFKVSNNSGYVGRPARRLQRRFDKQSTANPDNLEKSPRWLTWRRRTPLAASWLFVRVAFDWCNIGERGGRGGGVGTAAAHFPGCRFAGDTWCDSKRHGQ